MPGIKKPLAISQILKWADWHHKRTGQWPTTRTGFILDQPDRTWMAVDTALIKGACGLRGGSSLHRLLRARRRVPDPRMAVPGLTLKQVLKWADSHRTITGEWPHCDSGLVLDCPWISWTTIERRMKSGRLSLPRGTTLTRWLRKARSVCDGGKPLLTKRLVLDWAQKHFDRHGRWPVTQSGPVHRHPKENWATIDVALRNQRRGFPEKSSLSRLLRGQFGVEYDAHIGRMQPAAKCREPRFISVPRDARGRKKGRKKG